MILLIIVLKFLHRLTVRFNKPLKELSEELTTRPAELTSDVVKAVSLSTGEPYANDHIFNLSLHRASLVDGGPFLLSVKSDTR